MAINAQHPQYTKYAPKWKMINDIIDQENLEQYLIKLNSDDDSPRNKKRNDDYMERAVFFALTAETVKGQVGLIFSKEPECEVPAVMDYIKENIDGRGNSIIQQSKRVSKNVNSISRDGLYTSYPITEGEVSKADINNGLAVATIQQIKADRIINWRTESFGSQIKVVLVVFKDNEEIIEDYKLEKIETLRELFLEDNTYKERTWVKIKDKEEWEVRDTHIPLDKNGTSFDEIQFDFLGAINNDSQVDIPNQLGMVKLNIAHYRNSADYEDNVWYIGQSQSWMSGITQTHINLMKENNMYVGSRELLGVPSGEQFAIASAPENPLVRQAMRDKVEMMINLGAQQISVGGVAKTAEQTEHEKGSQYSTLSTIADNVSEAYTRALERVEMFMVGSVSGTVSYELNSDFIKPNINPSELKEIIAGFLSNVIPVTDYIRKMKQIELFDKDKLDKDYAEELESSEMPNMDE